MTLRSVFLAALLLVVCRTHADKGSEPPPCVSVAQLGPGSCVPAGSTIDIEVTLTADCSPPVQALGYREELPPGWTFKGVRGEDVPVDAPALNATGTLEFIWIKVPTFPVVFTITVAVSGDEVGLQSLAGRAEYRQSDGALLSDVNAVSICLDDASEGEGEGCAFPTRNRLEGGGQFLGTFLTGVLTLVVLAGFRGVAGGSSW